jgi:hypothetical protein
MRTIARLVFLLAALLLVAPLAAAADGPATFAQLKGLAGSWSGHMEDPDKGPPVHVRYEVVSGGKAVVEYQNPGESFEMITVYYLANGNLQATHYCGAGNQPAYRLGADSTAERAVLEFAGGTGFDPDKDGHVHEGEIRFVAPDRIEHKWVHYVGRKAGGGTHWFLTRDKQM